MKLRRYRIVADNYSGYEVQVWRLWFPFWIQHGFVNTYSSIEKAENYIEKIKPSSRRVVKYID